MGGQTLEIEAAVHHGVHHLPQLLPPGLGDGVQRDHVDHQPLMDVQIHAVAVDEGGVVVLDLRGGVTDVESIVGADAGVVLCVRLFVPDTAELFIVIPQHEHVHVVVPGDEALVAHGTQTGTAGQHEAQPVLLTELLKIQQDLQELALDLLYRDLFLFFHS